MFYIYNLLLLVTAPLLVVFYLPIFLLKKKHRKNFFLRFHGPALSEKKEDDESLRVWIHAVSVGEVLASLPLLKGMREVTPHASIYLSVITLTGYSIAKEKAGDLVESIFYLPFDFYPLMKRTVKKVSPDLLIIMETELWPNFIDAAKSSGARVTIVNGRISDKSFPKYRFFKFFFRDVLKRVDLFLMQSSKDSEKIQELGAHGDKVQVIKNLKYDIENVETAHLKMVGEKIRSMAAGRKIVIIGSTHEGEERILLDSLFDEIGRVFLIIAPRHPERFDKVEEIIKSYGVSCVRRSDVSEGTKAGERIDLMILDTLGELSGLYEIADIVIVGGSFVEVGGHNVLEPASFGIPVITGIYHGNFKEVVEEMSGEEAIIVAEDTRDLKIRLTSLLHDREVSEKIGKSAYNLVKNYRGLGVRVASWLVQGMA